MPTIQPFHALRYDLGHVGALSQVVAPPYDVIDNTLQDQLYKMHPANVVRLILNRSEPGDTGPDDRYNRAAQFFRNWRKEGVLRSDPQASVYFYQQKFDFEGKSYTRGGFLSRVRLEPFGTGKIFPHEETHAAAKADRFKLMSACRANLSPVFGLYPDPENAAGELLAAAARGIPPIEAEDHLGVLHSLTVLSDPTMTTRLAGIMGPKPIFIADGHHRYETSLAYREQLGKDLPAEHPANYVLMMCVSMSDPGMIVLSTHRLFRGLPAFSSDELAQKLKGHFDVQVVGEGGDLATMVWERISSANDQGSLGLFCEADQRWLIAKVNAQGRETMRSIASDHSQGWRDLGVSILHRLVMDYILKAEGLPKPMYVHSIDEVIRGIDQGDSVGRDATGQEGQGGKFPLVALVMPATVQDVRDISETGERMPAKSTYFYPKLLSGLVLNPLDS